MPDPHAGAIQLRQTSRLILRRVTGEDREFLVDLFARPELVAHRPHPIADTPAATDTRLQHDIAHWNTHGFGRWVLLRDGVRVGVGGLSVRADVQGLNLSYHLHPTAWGLGLATEFVADAVAVGLGELRARRIVALIRPVNVTSRAVAERAGFTFEAMLDLDGAPTQVFVKTAASIGYSP